VERALQPPRSSRLRQQLGRQLDAARRALQRKADDLTELLSITKAVLSTTDHGQLLGRLLDSALLVAEAEIAWIMLRDEESEALVLKAHRNLPPAWAKKVNQPLDDGLSSLVRLSGQALTIHGLPLEKFKVAGLGKSAAVLPLKVHDEVLGILIVIRRADRAFNKDMEALLEGIADFASISVVNSGLFRAPDGGAPSGHENTA
jgi:GAF domain-containing protein